MSRSAMLRAITLAALLSTAPAAAHAQFGKLIKKAAQGAVQGAAEGAAQNAAKGATPERARESRDASVTITPENLDLLLAALAPAAKAAQEYEAQRARYEAQNAKFEAHRVCRDSVKKRNPTAAITQSQALANELGEYSIALSAMMQRQAAAQQAGDTARAYAIADSAGAAGEKMENKLVPQLKACGAYVPSPSKTPPSGGGDAGGGGPSIPSGMTATQFGRLREKVAAWLLTDGKYKVTDGERSALDARKQQLDALTPLFKGNMLTWSSWGDLK